jgi:hypothetical protein
MFFKRKTISIPTNETKEVEVTDVWVVSWSKRIGEFHGETRICYQAFIQEEDARSFKKSLENAHALIGNTSGTWVSIEKQSK